MRTRASMLRLCIAGALALFGCTSSPSESSDGAELAAKTVDVPLSTFVQTNTSLQRILARPAEGEGWRDDDAGWTSVGLRGADTKRWNDVGARAPHAANGAFEIGVSVFAATTITLHARGATAAAGEVRDGTIVYPCAFGPDVDLVAAATHTTGELGLYIRRAESAASFSWSTELGSGIARVRGDAGGGLRFEDARGQTVLHVPRPYAIDAHGNRRDGALRYDPSEKALTVQIDSRGLAFPIFLDPAFETGSWERLQAPPKRDGQAVAYDSARGNLVLFGGYDSGAFNDTWLWNGATWTEATPTPGTMLPVARSAHMMAFDSVRGQVVLFGGEATDDSELTDTWTFDGAEWKQAQPTTSPPGRHYGAMTFDATRQRVVLFGGLAGTTDLADTWLWDGANWTQATPAHAPAPRSRHGLAFAPSLGSSVLFSGVDDSSSTQRDGWTRYTDTWTWDGTDWTMRAPATSPSGREYVTLSYDPSKADVLLFGGVDKTLGPQNDVWAWNGTTWTKLAATTTATTAPASRYWPTIGADVRGRTILYGGWNGTSENLNDTWAWNGTIWEQALVEPSFRDGMKSVYDQARGVLLLFGGYEGSNGNDTWTYDGLSWTQHATSTAPSGRFEYGLAYDSVRAVTVLFGGNDATGAEFNDTWTWNGSTWTQKSPAKSPSVRVDMAMSFDPGLGKTVLFGGYDTSGDGTFLGDTWTWDGTSWTNVAPADSPDARFGAMMEYDAKNHVTTLFGGESSVLFDSDLWTFDGTTWTSAPPIPAPSARSLGGFAFDSVRNVMVLYGGRLNATYFTDTWNWDGTGWTDATPTSGAPNTSEFFSMTFFPPTGKTVLFGGSDGTYLWGDTWLYSTSGGGCTSGSQCDSGHCTDGVCCSVASCGTCEACNTATPGVCEPVQNAPDPDSCTGSQSCDASGACKASNGQMCTAAVQCASGSCVDGVCCNSACDGQCQACTAAAKGSGADGTCGDVANGLDPRNDCPDDGANLCGHDGTCSGQGSCRLYGAGTSCGSSSCDEATNRAIGMLCDGLGSCVPSDSTGVDCGAFVCDVVAGGCVTSCTTDDQCDIGNYCANGTCIARSTLGATCTTSAGCPVGAHCTDGVCCNTQCEGQCESCALTGTVGTCVFVTGAPKAGRAACAASTSGDPCATTVCDGLNGATCAGFVGPETSCRVASCSGAVAVVAASCTGSGTCPAATDVPCAPFACDGAVCATRCASDTDCDARYRCDTSAHTCIAREGSSCDGDHTVNSQNGESTDCTPYKCSGSSCLATCESIEQCTVGNVCNGAGKCAPPQAPSLADGCSLPAHSPNPSDRSTAWLVGLSLGAALLRGRSAGAVRKRTKVR